MKQEREVLNEFKGKVEAAQVSAKKGQDREQGDTRNHGKKRSLKSQLFWMMGLWLGGVISLYLFVKLVKVIMSLVGLYASP